MSVSLREIYDKIKSQSNEDISSIISLSSNDSGGGEVEYYNDLNSLRDLINALDEERSATTDGDVTVSCEEHESFAINTGKLSLKKIHNNITSIKGLVCENNEVKACECESLAGCACNTRTLTCSSVISYSSGGMCPSRTTYYCACNAAYGLAIGGYYYYIYYYCSSNSAYYSYTCSCDGVCGCVLRTVSYSDVASGCILNAATYYSYTCSCNAAYSCSCQSVAGYGSSAYYYYYSYYYYTVSCSSNCECTSRTTTNPCACNTRSEGLCASRVGCSCDQVCYCNNVKQFK
jgi:hypothetical protein